MHSLRNKHYKSIFKFKTFNNKNKKIKNRNKRGIKTGKQGSYSAKYSRNPAYLYNIFLKYVTIGDTTVV